MKKNISAEKYITMSVFEKAMASIARSFSKIEEKLDKTDQIASLVLKEMQIYREESKENRMTMSLLNHNEIKQEHRVSGLELRIEKLEQKIK